MSNLAAGQAVTWMSRAQRMRGRITAIGDDYAEIQDETGAEWCVMQSDLRATA